MSQQDAPGPSTSQDSLRRLRKNVPEGNRRKKSQEECSGKRQEEEEGSGIKKHSTMKKFPRI
jgi:hypothetical protein